MVKRSDDNGENEWVKVKEEELEEAPSEESKTVCLILLKEMRLKYTGPISGKLYVFDKAGSVLDIDEADVEIMLAKHGGSCCSGTKPQPYFAIYKEG